MKNLSRIVWGMILVLLGLVIGVNTLGIAEIDIFFDGWWTLFIIIPSVLGLIEGNDRKGALIGLIIGVGLLLGARGIIDYSLLVKLIVPIILVVIGISVMFDGVFEKSFKAGFDKAKPTGSYESLAGVLSEEIRVVEDEFVGSTVDAVFGHAVLSLKKCKMPNDATIKASAIFGAVDIIVPDDIVVIVRSTKILGSVNKYIDTKEKKKSAKTLYIDAFAMFGGVNIK